MLSLELWTKNSQGERTYQGTYRRTWKTMRGLENFRQKVMDYNGYTLEDFKIKGEESRKDNTKAVGTLKSGRRAPLRLRLRHDSQQLLRSGQGQPQWQDRANPPTPQEL